MVLDLLNWTKISGTNFFLLASLGYIIYTTTFEFMAPPSVEKQLLGLGVWRIVESLPTLMEKSRNFLCSGKWAPTPNKYEYWMTA